MTGSNRSTTKIPKNSEVSWAQAIRDMVVAAIDRGQLPVFGLFLVILGLIFKMPEDKVYQLIYDILRSLRHGELIAYILFFATLMGWFAHARFMRKQFRDEADRIGREKSDLQSKVAGVAFQSSDQK